MGAKRKKGPQKKAKKGGAKKEGAKARSAVSGKYVSKSEARRNPRETVTECDELRRGLH